MSASVAQGATDRIEGELGELDIKVTGRHMDIGDAFRVRIEDRLADAVGKHVESADRWSATVRVEKEGSRFSADCTVHIDQGAVFHAEGRSHDPVPAFEEAADRLEKRLRRHKRRLKEHRPHRRAGGRELGPEATEMAFRVLSAPKEDEEVADDFVPAIIAETTREARQMSVSSAVLALDMGDEPVFVFRNAKDDRINLVYRRSDGHVGWLDASGESSSG